MTDEELTDALGDIAMMQLDAHDGAIVAQAIARIDALRAEHTDRASLARQVQIARMALADIAEGRDEVQCLAGGPAEPGRHCVVHGGARGCQACQAADRVERLHAVADAARLVDDAARCECGCASCSYCGDTYPHGRLRAAMRALDGGGT